MALKIEVSADKYLYSFYKYLPTKYEASKQEWAVRQLIWDFKNGKGGFEVGKMVAEKIITQFGKRCKEMVFVCVPASNNEKNTKRYEIFSQTVCRMTGMRNGFSHLSIEGNRLAVHETKTGKSLKNTQIISFDETFFNGKDTLIFDDIITQGYSFSLFSQHLETMGANVLGGIFLGQTIAR